MKNQVKIVGIILIMLLFILSLTLFFNKSEKEEETIYVSFPEDEWPHNETVEWYYWTGHLETNEGRWFGYELVFFIYKINGQQRQTVHSAVTDIQKNTFNYTIQSSINPIPRSGEPLQFEVSVFSASLNNGNDKLYSKVDNYTIDLDLKSLKPPVLQHEVGYKSYEFGGYTYYYSRTRINTTGTITFKNGSYQENGTSWFDQRWGDLIPATLLGWDWYAIQLDDGREIMLFDIHSGQEKLLTGGTLVDEDGTAVEIMPEEFTATVLDELISSKTGVTYPSGWKISVKGIDLILQPVIKDQEVATSSYAGYWEGACTVEGDLTGRAYVELTGYLSLK